MSTHPIFPVSIENSAGKLVLTPCPGTQEVSLPETLESFHHNGIAAVVTLMTTEELAELSVANIGKETKALGMIWFHLPIIDEQTPDAEFIKAWQTAGPAIHRLLEKHKSVAVHCKGGSGRTGMVATQILLERGEPMQEVIQFIRRLRPNAFTLPAQLAYIRSLQQDLACV